MAGPKLTIFLDVVSPFAYMAFYFTKNATIFKNCEVTYVPMFLGGVMKACDNKPPIQIKNKDKWINLERVRWARYCDIPMSETMPDGFPPLTLHVMRALSALQLTRREKLIDAFDALYRGMWVERRPIHKPEVYTDILTTVLGEETAKEVLTKAGEKEAKGLLQENTDACLAEGAFGLPWFVATNKEGHKESYWGFDHLGQVIEHLGLDRKQAPELRAML
ncbi:putative 2-hydroxychromene-2-carboxylate isomerase [Delphinella strobiligena]|nr:putative 2-hydroxychromene-2-carboxylate isomerase [Delphinella strobiligena]